MLAVIFYFCCIGLLVTASLIAPALVGLLVKEDPIALRLGFYILIGSFLFGGPVLGIFGRLTRITPVNQLLLVALVWALLPLLVALPMWDLSGLSFLDAWFETVSALTTSGASVHKTLDALSQTLLFWRVQLQWLGGYLALLSILLIIAPLRVGGLVSTRETLSTGIDVKHRDRRLLVFAINLGLIYALLTALCFLLLFLSGARAFHAVTLAMTATSTGGFLPFDRSLDETLNLAGTLVFGVFLAIGATSIFWQRMVMRGKVVALMSHRESYFVLILIGFLTLVFTYLVLSVSAGSAFEIAPVVVEAFVNAASLVATSGIETRPGYFTLFPLVIVLFLILLGGSVFSTSGGIKHYRMGGMLVQSWSELDRLVYPSGVRASRFGTNRYDIQLMKAIWSFLVAAILTICVGALLVSASGLPFEPALTAVIANFSTAGPAYLSGWAGPGAEAWPHYASFPTSAKMVLLVVMLLGRLEVLAVVSLFSARYWWNR